MLRAIGFVVRDVRVERVRERSGVNDNYAEQSGYVRGECVPTYPETILDDHNGYTTTEYVELTKRLIDSVAGTYAVDSGRIYGTGQSMGCMTTLILASEYPDLYAACMFVDGQWDASKLKGLEGQTFVYFAAEDDERSFNHIGISAARLR